MKKYFFVLALSMTTLLWTACESDAPPITFHDSIQVNDSNVKATIGDDGTKALSFNASDEWTISVADTSGLDWCKVSPMSGQGGNVTVSITAQPNMLDNRSAVILIDVHGTQVAVDAFQEFGNAVEDIPIPDERLREYVHYTYDKNRDGKVSFDEVKNVTNLLIQSKGITSLQGVEYFKSLKKLDLCYNEVTQVNTNRNPELEYLCCDMNQVTSLDFSNCKKLTEIVCSNNLLTTISVSNQLKLIKLDCSNNEIEILDVGKNPELDVLKCQNNKLRTLDVSNNLKMSTLHCWSNNTSELWLKEGQVIPWIIKDYETEIKYK